MTPPLVPVERAASRRRGAARRRPAPGPRRDRRDHAEAVAEMALGMHRAVAGMGDFHRRASACTHRHQHRPGRRRRHRHRQVRLRPVGRRGKHRRPYGIPWRARRHPGDGDRLRAPQGPLRLRAPPGAVDVKGKGPMPAYLLLGRKGAPSAAAGAARTGAWLACGRAQPAVQRVAGAGGWCRSASGLRLELPARPAYAGPQAAPAARPDAHPEGSPMHPYRSAQQRDHQVFARRRVLGSGASLAAGAGALGLAACGAQGPPPPPTCRR